MTNTKTQTQNEIAVAETPAHLTLLPGQSMEQGEYIVSRDAEGKFSRKAKYKFFSSVTPESKEEKIKFFNLLNGDEEAISIKDNTGVPIPVQDVIFNPYEGIDEETGVFDHGVLTYLITPDGLVYVTSSKSVYHSMKNMFKVFGEPHYTDETRIIVTGVMKKGQKHQYVDVTLVG
ncbi:single strand DNA binding protein [Bacillus phage VMY22]|uniref:Single stranded DNA-binding protein n=1 Tax=Bacillus phage VMY22 TaxID=1734382 RepID=A0A0N9RTQ6_9CAUD|nr:single strand DNA binding protein [Bacillus phage VMY22]ALH46475.1 single stranded DNA-binding protein [Bacillus phage VMY22]